MTASITRLPERNLDLLRAIAVVCVLIDHVVIAASPVDDKDWGWVGRAGVLIFFVHTALVLMGSLERSGGTRPGWVWRFYVRRAWRIYPLAIATILLVIALGIPDHTVQLGSPRPFHRPDDATILSNMLLIQNLVAKNDVLGVLWTLPIEVQMYVALPLCFLLARRSVRAVLLLLVAGMIAALVRKAGPPIPGLWRLGVLAYVPCFLGGVLAYSMLRRSSAPRISAVLSFVVIGALMAAFFAMRMGYESLVAQWAFCLALGIVIANSREMTASVISRLSHVIAKYSYGIYLLHLPALWIAAVPFAGAPRGIQWLIFAILVVALPWLAFHLIERPGIAVGQRMVHQRIPQQTPVGAP